MLEFSSIVSPALSPYHQETTNCTSKVILYCAHYFTNMLN